MRDMTFISSCVGNVVSIVETRCGIFKSWGLSGVSHPEIDCILRGARLVLMS